MKVRRRKKLTGRLMAAVLGADAAAVTDLLRAGADPTAADREGTTPLYLASVQGVVDVVRILLAAGAPPDVESGRGQEGTALCAAAAWGHTEVVRELLAHGADPNLREDHGTGRSALDWAIGGAAMSRRSDPGSPIDSYTETADVLRAAGAQQTSWSTQSTSG